MSGLKEFLESESLSNNELGDLVQAHDYPAIASFLNTRPLIPNPNPITQIPAPVELETLLGILTAEEAGNLIEIENANAWITQVLKSTILPTDPVNTETAQILAKAVLAYLVKDGKASGKLAMVEIVSELASLEIPDKQSSLGSLVQLLTLMGVFTEATATALSTAMAQTIDDPDYAAEVFGNSLAMANDLGTVTASQVQGALN